MAGWGLSEQEQAIALHCLQEIAQDYPSLDAEPVWRTPAGRAFVACVQSSSDVRGSRQYLHQQPNEIVLFDGCMVDAEGRINAMRSENLAAHWDSLPERLEGCFSILRIRPEIPEMELLTDYLGMTQVFYASVDGKLMISNSARLLARLCKDSTLDPLGISLTLSLGWASGDRTLNRAVQIVPSGAHWRWTANRPTPAQLQYYSPTDLFRYRKKKKVGRSEARELSDRMVALLRAFENDYKIQCPLTGGRDTRLMLSFILRGKLSADYYTDATTHESDVNTAVAIAERLHLPLRIHRPDPDIFSSQWDKLICRLVRQHDGLLSLYQIADLLPGERTPPEIPIRLLGIGGGIARRAYRDPRVFFLKKNDLNGATLWLERQTLYSYSGLVKESAMTLARQFVRDWVAKWADTGYSFSEMPDFFHTFEKIRRWGGVDYRKVQESHDVFSPLCTRPFVEAAFHLPVWNRYAEPLHYQLTRLIPELHAMPFGKDPWLTQLSGLAFPHLVIRKKVIQPLTRKLRCAKQIQTGTFFNIHRMIVGESQRIRTFCMDNTSSPLWDFLDRRRFEEIIKPDTDANTRTAYTDMLCRIATLFYYEAFQD